MSTWMLYLILKLNCIRTFLLLIALISLSLALFFLLSEQEESKTGIWVSSFIFLITFPIFVALPSTKQALYIYFVPKLINNQKIEHISTKTINLLDQYLDLKIKEIKQREEKHGRN